MPRTPLFRVLQRSFRLARLSAETGRPPDEIVDEVREAREARDVRDNAGLTRRQLLGGTAAAAGLALVGCRPFAPPPRTAVRGNGRRVVIIGAGISGLTAGYRLSQQGVSVRILEGQDRVGGRMFSQRGFFPDGQVAELGGELIDTGHVHMRKLAAELEIPLDDFVLDDPDLDRDVFFFEGRRIAEHEVVRAFLPVSRRVVWDRSTLTGSWVSHAEPNGGERLDRTPLSEWLAGAGAEPWLARLLDVAYTTEYGLEIAEQSALNFLLLIDPNPLPFRIFGESDERFHVRGGNDLIPRTLAERLGDRVETGRRVESVARRSDGSYIVSAGGGEPVTADHVVITVPFTMLRGEGGIRLDASLGIPEVQQRAIRELGYGTNAKLMVGFSQAALAPARAAVPLQRQHAHRPALPALLGGQPPAAGHRRHPHQLHRRPARAGAGGGDAGGAGREVRPRDRPRLPGRRGDAPAGEAVPLPLADLPVDAGELHLLPPRPVDRLRRRGGAPGGQPPLRWRAHLGERLGVHGGRLRDRGAGGDGDPRRPGEGELRRSPAAAYGVTRL